MLINILFQNCCKSTKKGWIKNQFWSSLQLILNLPNNNRIFIQYKLANVADRSMFLIIFA